MTAAVASVTARGAMLLDVERLDLERLHLEDWGAADPARAPGRGLALEARRDAAVLEALFEPRFWAARGATIPAGRGRGSAWFLEHGAQRWVLRHYRRGGLVARFVRDRYLWLGESRVRAFAEFRLLERLHAQGLPVPRPIGARYARSGPTYRCDLITERIAAAVPLSTLLAEGGLPDAGWRAVGRAIAGLHRAQVDHADLNAHNILLDPAGVVSVIDFDRGRLRAAGRWMSRNLERLHRSLEKIARRLPPDRFSRSAWMSLLDGYRAAVP